MMTFNYEETEVVTPSSLYRETRVTPGRYQNQHSAEDGTAYVYDHLTEETFIEISMRCTYSEYEDIRDFFVEDTLFGKNQFTITPDSNLDCGFGLGVPVLVRLWQKTLPIVYDAPGRFPIKLILRIDE